MVIYHRMNNHFMKTNHLYLIIIIMLLSIFQLKTPGIAANNGNELPKITRIAFIGNDNLSSDSLMRLLPYSEGTIYARSLVLEGKYYLTNYYQNNGFKYVQVTQESIADESTGNYHILYQVEEGIKAYIGSIKISGNTKTTSPVILRELAFHPGELYNSRNIFISHNRLQALNYFEDVKIEELHPESTTRQVDILVTVSERNTGLLSFGGGFSTEEGIRGFARYRQNNLFGLGQQFSAGIKWAEKGQTYQRSREIRMDYFNPHFDDSNTGIGMESYYRRENLDNYDLYRLGAGIYATKDIWGGNTQATLKYRIESDKTFNISNTYDAYMLSIDNQTNLITQLSMNITQDRRNNIPYPTRGHIYSIDAAVASELLGGDVSYLKLVFDGRWYYTIHSPEWILALRIKSGFEKPVEGMNRIPIYERLFAGGADSVRGFKERYLGPKDVDGFPQGGNANLIYSVELRFPVYKSLGGVAFYDSGNVWDKAEDFNPFDVKHSVGAGLRYQTPIGPIRFDYGLQVPREDGGRFHLSVGQTF